MSTNGDNISDIVDDALADLDTVGDRAGPENQDAQAAISIAQDALQSVSELRSETDERFNELEERISELASQVERVDERTDMLDLIEQADTVSYEQRSAALFQHLKRQANARPDDQPARASADHDDAEKALHFPDVERTTIYRDMQRVERWVGDEDVCWYNDGALHLDLDAADDSVSVPHNSAGGERL